jgi:hypothetical protein
LYVAARMRKTIPIAVLLRREGSGVAEGDEARVGALKD